MSFPSWGCWRRSRGGPDFRQAQGQRHALSAILASVMCGVQAGQSRVKQIVHSNAPMHPMHQCTPSTPKICTSEFFAVRIDGSSS